MRVDNQGATRVATSIDRGESIRSEKDAGGVKGVWNRLRIATTKDKQLAVHVRGTPGAEQKRFVATGVGSGELRRLRRADINGHVLPPVLRTARSILSSAGMRDDHFMSDKDLVRLANLTASANFKVAEAIYTRAEAQGNDLTLTNLVPELLTLAEQHPQLGLEVANRIINPGGTDVSAQNAIRILGKVSQHNPQAAIALAKAFPGHMAALGELEGLADRLTNGPPINFAAANQLLNLASTQPSSAGKLATTLCNSTQTVTVQNFVHDLDQLKTHNVASTTINRLAHIGSHNLGVGEMLAGLVENERANPGADASLASRFVRQVRQDINTGGVISQNVGAPNANNDKAEMFNSFRNLLVREFGTTIADNVFNAHLQVPRDGHQTLDMVMMQNAIAAARQQQDQAATLVNLQSPTPNVSSFARQQAALKAFNNAAQNGMFPDSERAEMYRAEMLQFLRGVATNTYQVDATGDNSLLTKLAVQVVKKEFDGKALEGLRNHFESTHEMDQDSQHFSYGEGLSNLVDQGVGALDQFKTVTYPTLGHLFTTGTQNAIAYFNGAFANLHNDISAPNNPVGNRFFSGGNIAGGLTDVIVTGSDPHKKGERVLIFKFPPALPNGPDRQLVYKPRDVRMDALLTGNRGANHESDSLADIVNNHLGPNSVPTYNFLAGPGSPENYGYVEFVPNGRTQDVKMTPAEAKQFYREYGRQVAMYVLTGTRDLHQTNMYVSNKRPVFTDLELSVDPQSLEFLINPPLDGTGNCDLTQAGSKSSSLSSALQLDNSLFARGEKVRRETAKVEDDRLQSQSNTSDEPVTESFVWIDGIHQGQQLDIDNSMSPKPSGNGSPQQFGADDFEAGFQEVINVLADNNTQLDLTGFVQSLNGLHLRYHPLATGLQLAPRQEVTTSHLGDDDNERTQFLENRIDQGLNGNRRTRLNGLPGSDNQVATRIRDAAVADLNIGDVAYFTRELGGAHRELVHHHPQNGPTVIHVNQGTGDTAFFNDDGLGTLQSIFLRLNGNANGFKDYVNALGAGIANSCRTTGGRGMDSVSLRNNLL